MDLSKAFDTLDHTILLQKFVIYGVRGKALDWLTSYLKNRKQSTVIAVTQGENLNSNKSDNPDNNSKIKSEALEITCGVPQGSILGPFLFLVYINDIPTVLTNGMPILFADDTNVLFHSKSLTNLEDIVNTELKRLADWFNANKLSLNIKKTKFMLFHTKQRAKHIGDFSIRINHEKIDRVEKIRFLGLTLQENISWDEHCNLVTNKISSVVGILYKIRIFLPIKTLLQIYNSLILPHLYYGILAWGGAPRTTLTKIETIQKRAMRVIMDPLITAIQALSLPNLIV